MPSTSTHELNIRLSALIEALPLGLVIVDADCVPVLTNRELIRLIDYDSDQSVVTQLNEQFDLQNICQESWKRQSNLPPREQQIGQRYVRLLVNPIMEGDKPLGAVMLVEDITEKKVLDRTRNEFFAVAAHELRTPLTAIRGNADLIRQEIGPDPATPKQNEIKSMVTDIYHSCCRLLLIVNDFLDASRLELGRIEFNLQPLDVNNLISEVVHELKTNADAKHIDLHYIIPAGHLPHVTADPVRAKQVIVNLVGNAIKFTHQGGVAVTAKVEDSQVVIRVADTGTGIPTENQRLLFRKFQQAGANILSRDMTQGTGMGLYICKLLAQGMHGHIGLEHSQIGQGSTFYFSLPIAG